ncbi:hypothetical protein L6R52_24065, partial [Myxococcota bacterium]|nr:hypothetical protein [Myxococcota bacterium]
EGTFVQDWVTASRKASTDGVLPRLSRAEVQRRLADLAETTPEQLRGAKTVLREQPQLAAKIGALKQEIATVRADAKTQPTSASAYDARRRRAIGTETEAALDTTMMRQLAGVGALPITEQTMAISSPLQAANPSLGRALKQLREVRLAERGSCIREEAPAPATWTGLSDALQLKFGRFDPTEDKGAQLERAERMRRYLAETAHTSVILHEMGHSFALRHNFVSSSDAWGFRPQYWQLRTKNGAITTECDDLTADGAACVGPRWFDPMTEEERSNLLHMFMQSSVMDYAGDYSQDLLGLGAYDFAAVRMFYGDVVAVHANAAYDVGSDRGTAMLAKADGFGGILGFTWSTDGDTNEHAIHYSQLQKHFDLISGCRDVDPNLLRPEAWSDAKSGTWSPLLDGKLVAIDGVWSRCEQQKVDYTSWPRLRDATEGEAGGLAKKSAIDPAGRTRVPYGFATDRWADLGNLAVYRHDNGADAYELFDFFISEQEVNHIFDNYRRGRESFSVRSAVMRTLGRYNEKMRDGAKGLGLFANIYRDFSLAEGYDFRTLWPVILSDSFGSYNPLATNALAAGMAFDHFARQLGRPEAGEHFRPDGDDVLRSANDARGNAGDTVLVVPNGVAGMEGGVSIGGRPVENALADDQGEYDSDYTINAGSYYEKLFSSMLLTESVDNFISDSRGDFVDGRYRAVSMADVFPEGYRRWLSTNLTGDEALKAAWIPAITGEPMVDEETKFPTRPLGWTSWWATQPKVCAVSDGAEQCTTQDVTSPDTASFLPVDAEVGWEQQKFLIAWTLVYLPENQQRWWLDMMGLWSLGEDSDPAFENRIELHDPSGRVFIAKTFGKETLLGKSVERGIAARVLQHANELLARAYVTDDGPDLDHDGTPDWYVPRLGTNGQPLVKFDPSIVTIAPNGGINPAGRFGCNSSTNASCTCTENRACVELQRYMAVPSFLRTALRDFGLADPSMRGLF